MGPDPLEPSRLAFGRCELKHLSVVAASALSALATWSVNPQVAVAQEPGPRCRVCIEGDGDAFAGLGNDFGARDGVPAGRETVSGRKTASDVIIETRYVPTCSANTNVEGAVLCTSAVELCLEPAETRFWVFQRAINPRAPSEAPPFRRVTPPAFVCLAPDDPRVDPTVAIPAIIDRDFQRIVVLKGVARVTPAPDTLVNVETRFATDAPTSYEIPLTVLGQLVVITASAVTWTWHFGDGTQQRLTDGSSGGSTVHEYRESGPRAAYVVIEWTGTYVIGGDPTVRQVNGTATTIGEPTQIAVRTARSELVDQPG